MASEILRGEGPLMFVDEGALGMVNVGPYWGGGERFGSDMSDDSRGVVLHVNELARFFLLAGDRSKGAAEFNVGFLRRLCKTICPRTVGRRAA
jgi:hypothetical protein